MKNIEPKMIEDKIKVLVLNPLPSQVDKAVKIVNIQNEKAGPFDFSLFLGDVFLDQEANIETLNPKIPIYYSEGEKNVTVTEKLPDSFTYLGKVGTYKLVNGLTIGFVSGNLENYTSEDISRKFEGKEVDILMTYHWPEAIAKEEKLVLCGNKKLDSLINIVKPRYWFASGTPKGRFFEREAYSIDGKITRFISLSTMGEGRWWYAFKIELDPFNDNKIKVGFPPTLNTEDNVIRVNKRPLEEEDNIIKKNSKGKSELLSVTPAACFLCLANPNFELHMVISVANLSYLTISKGPLTLKKPLGFSGHGMIVPIEHYATFREYVHHKESHLKVEDSALASEVTKLQKSLVAMFRSLGEYSVVFWEISRKRSVHCHLQFVPVHDCVINNFERTLRKQIEYDKRLYPEPLLYQKFVEGNDNLDKLSTIINNQNYVLFTLYEKGSVTKYVIELGTDEDKYFDAQFPRKVMAVLLNLRNRIRWDKCTESRDEESLQKGKFQQAYRPFDIMLSK